jgi:hypothetical protein
MQPTLRRLRRATLRRRSMLQLQLIEMLPKLPPGKYNNAPPKKNEHEQHEFSNLTNL